MVHLGFDIFLRVSVPDSIKSCDTWSKLRFQIWLKIHRDIIQEFFAEIGRIMWTIAAISSTMTVAALASTERLLGEFKHSSMYALLPGLKDSLLHNVGVSL